MKSWDESIKSQAHPSWHDTLFKAIRSMDHQFLGQLDDADEWLPGKDLFLSAFSMPVSSVKNILVGESPYPRKESSCGYCFFDASVKSLWSDQGISKKANRATSLRNFLKMLMVARGDLEFGATGKQEISELDKSGFVDSAENLFIDKLVKENGFLLLNLSLSLIGSIKKEREAKYWMPFMEVVFNHLKEENPDVNLVLFGKVAEAVSVFESSKGFNSLVTEHPYNVSFIGNQDAIDFFGPMDLLSTT